MLLLGFAGGHTSGAAVPVVGGWRVGARGSGRVRGRAAIGTCTHTLVALVVPVVGGRRVCAPAGRGGFAGVLLLGFALTR